MKNNKKTMSSVKIFKITLATSLSILGVGTFTLVKVANYFKNNNVLDDNSSGITSLDNNSNKVDSNVRVKTFYKETSENEKDYSNSSKEDSNSSKEDSMIVSKIEDTSSKQKEINVLTLDDTSIDDSENNDDFIVSEEYSEQTESELEEYLFAEDNSYDESEDYYFDEDNSYEDVNDYQVEDSLEYDETEGYIVVNEDGTIEVWPSEEAYLEFHPEEKVR